MTLLITANSKRKRIFIVLLFSLILAGGLWYVVPLYRARQFILMTSDQSTWPRYHIYSMLPDGSRMRRITRGLDPACSPDGHQIAFAASTNAEENLPSHIFVINTDGTDKKQLTFGKDIGVLPSWSPDGRTIAFNSAVGIGMIDVNTQEVTYLFDDNDPWKVHELAWSPDNLEIVFYAYIPGPTDYFIEEGLYISKPDGSNMRKLTDAWDRGPDWSPDGKSIVFLHQEPDDSPYILRIIRTDGSFVRDIDLPALKLSNPSHPKWSPDGQRIIFSADYYDQAFQGYKSAVFGINMDGSDLRIIRESSGTTLGSEYGGIPLPRGVHYGNVDWCEVK